MRVALLPAGGVSVRPGEGNAEALPSETTRGDHMYIGGGALAVIIIIILLIWLL
jgi:hypothetical protein